MCQNELIYARTNIIIVNYYYKSNSALEIKIYFSGKILGFIIRYDFASNFITLIAQYEGNPTDGARYFIFTEIEMCKQV